MPEETTVYRIYNRQTGQYMRSGQSIYARNSRSIWLQKAGAERALQEVPAAVRVQCEIRAFRLERIES